MKLRYIILILLLCASPVFCADDSFIFGDDGLQPLDYAQITDCDDKDVIEITTSGSDASGSSIRDKTVGEIRDEINEKIDVDNRITRNRAVFLAAKYPGEHTIDQISSIYEYLKNGDEKKEGWRYVSDIRGNDYFCPASDSISIGEEGGWAGAGDCDDFAILMSALIEAVGGTTRIVLAYNESTGHAYTEVYLGRLDAPDHHVEKIVDWLKSKYSTNGIYTHIDSNTKEVWLNLDWSANHPGGPFFRTEKQVVLAVRGEMKKVPLNINVSTAISPNSPPELMSLNPNKDRPQAVGSTIYFDAQASDTDGDTMYYKYYLKGPSTDGAWQPVQDWSTDSRWEWTPSAEGDYEVEVGIRDGRHAGEDGRDAYTVAQFNVTYKVAQSNVNPVTIINLTSSLPKTSMMGHSEAVRSVSFSPDGRTLASGSDDNTIKLWDTETGQYIKTLEGHSGWVRSVAFSPDGLTLASGSDDNTIKLWDVATGRQLKSLVGHPSSVWCIAFSTDGSTLVSGLFDGTIELWDMQTGRLSNTLIAHSETVTSIAFSPDGRTFASGSRKLLSENDDILKLWDVQTGQELKTLVGDFSSVFSVSFSPNGLTLASGCDDSTIKLWDVQTERVLNTLAGHSFWVFSVAFSPDGNTLASSSGVLDNTIKLWDVQTGSEIRTITEHSGVYCVAFSPDGLTLASGNFDGIIKLWSVA